MARTTAPESWSVAPGSPPPAPVPAALPPLSAGIEWGRFYPSQGTQGPGPPAHPPAPQLTWKPQPSGPQPGRVRGHFCQSTSRAHILPGMPWLMGWEGSGGRNTSPWSPPHPTPARSSQRVPGEEGAGRRAWPLHGEGNQHASVLQEVSRKCFKRFARTRRLGAGGLAGLFHAILPRMAFTALAPATGTCPVTLTP